MNIRNFMRNKKVIMVNLFNLVPKINKQRIFKKLHIAEGTETYKNASSFFDEICKIIAEKMKITELLQRQMS